jgi:plasmid stabilization system protein ParE
VADLDEVWTWTAHRHGVNQADKYIEFLFAGVYELANSKRHRPVPLKRDCFYEILRWPNARDGHVVVYDLAADESRLTVLRVFHTKQNWGAQL